MRRILVVDDDLHVGQAISVWLKAQGFRVATAEAQRLEQMVRSARAKKLLPRTKSG